MKAMEEKIIREGQVLSADILKVGHFLNQQLDVDFLMEMGEEVARLYQGEKITKILTIEASGIAIATACAAHLHVPVVFVKKSKASTQTGEFLSASVRSFTHNNTYDAILPAEYLSPADRLLLVDDFLAHGEALNGMMEIARQAGSTVVGCAIAVEKKYQGGGDNLRNKGIRVESMAKIQSMDPEKGIVFCD